MPTVRYAGHEDAVVDLHLPGGSRPTGPDAPLVVLLHGGFWKQEWDRRHTRPMARALADLGLVVATPEYRRVRGGGGWPVTGDDVHLAVRRLPELLGGLGIATGPMVVTGHSAGGHLALWLATLDLPVARVVALAPVCDLDAAVRLRLGDDAALALLGDADLAVADPMTLLDGATRLRDRDRARRRRRRRPRLAEPRPRGPAPVGPSCTSCRAATSR